MALPTKISCFLLLSLLVALTPAPCTCEERAPVAMAGSSLIKCYDSLTNATNGTVSFRASLLPLLAALPSTAAPTGFASLSSAAAPTDFASLSSTDHAFVRGLCFGEHTVPSDCLGCLSAAARNLSAGCGATTRRAGIWTDRCFLAYADTNASSPADDAFRSRFLLWGHHADTDASSPAAEDAFRSPVPEPDAEAANSSHNQHAEIVALAQSAAANISEARMLGTADAATARSTVDVLTQCARDRTAAECVRCLEESARAVDWDIDADRSDGGVAAAVVGFNCYLRFEISTSVLPHSSPRIILGAPGRFAVAPAVAVFFLLFAMEETP